MVQDLIFFYNFFFTMAQVLEFFSHKNFLAIWLRTLNFLPKQQFFTMAQDLDFFFSIFQILHFSLGLKLYNFFSFQVYVNNVECKKHQSPIQTAMRAVKKHAPSNIMSHPC